jgi:hypothetical protein
MLAAAAVPAVRVQFMWGQPPLWGQPPPAVRGAKLRHRHTEEGCHAEVKLSS